MNLFKRIFTLFHKILFKIADLVVFISSICLIFSVGVQVFGRYVLNKSPRWSTELACFSLLFLVFWGAAIALKEGMHVEIDITKYKFPVGVLNIFRLVSIVSVYLFIAVIFYFGCLITINNVNSLSEAMKISYAYIYINVPISAFLMFVGFTEKNINIIRDREVALRC